MRRNGRDAPIPDARRGMLPLRSSKHGGASTGRTHSSVMSHKRKSGTTPSPRDRSRDPPIRGMFGLRAGGPRRGERPPCANAVAARISVEVVYLIGSSDAGGSMTLAAVLPPDAGERHERGKTAKGCRCCAHRRDRNFVVGTSFRPDPLGRTSAAEP